MNVLTPPQIMVEPFGYAPEGISDLGMSEYTALFREGTDLGAAFALATEHLSQDGPFTAVSAGCSYGPEVDAVLGLAHKYLPGRRVGITGVDNNTNALAEAEGPRYKLPFIEAVIAAYSAADDDFMAAMAEHGIGVSMMTPGGGGPSISAANLRAEHDVTWEQADLRKQLPVRQLSHLILCNNVVYNVSTAEASRMVRHLVAALAVGGVLSLGSNLQHAGMGEWYQGTAEELSEQGIVPVRSTAAPELAAFRRIAEV